jgi:hypothetical protein
MLTGAKKIYMDTKTVKAVTADVLIVGGGPAGMMTE